MYQPPLFREQRPEELHALIRAHPLGLLICTGANGDIEANPVPMLLDASAGDGGILKCHVARANPQWKMLRDNDRCLVVFQGPDAYVTPSWYQTKAETGKVVPTWNYATVQVRGIATIHEDWQWLAGQIRELTAAHENRRLTPWAVDDAPSDFIDSQIKGIVGIEIAITAMTGKWKVSQNRTPADRQGVITGLTAEATASATDMAALVQHRHAPPE